MGTDNRITLPVGLANQSYEDWMIPIDSDDTTPPEGFKIEKPDCTCGTWTTWGKDCDDGYHSDYCDIRRGKK